MKFAKIIGRVYKIRDHKTIEFLQVQENGIDIQVVLKQESFKKYNKHVKVGDVLYIDGQYGYTKTNQYSLFADNLKILARPSHVIPYGQHSQHRTEELIIKDFHIIKKRFEIINKVRHAFESKGFVHVDTPSLHPVSGGALAQPFKTYCRGTRKDLYLRISPELYLKRLVIAGFHKVFEMSKVFRNEGLDATHHPEFTLCEAYSANSTLEEWKDMSKELLIVLFEIYLENTPECLEMEPNVTTVDKYEEYIQTNVVGVKDKLVFVMGSPIEATPLAKQGRNGNMLLSNAIEVYYNGIELINCYEEENDPYLQEQKMQTYLGKVDDNYIQDLHLGMPPTTGWGLGIDRLIMILTKSDKIASVIPFPLRGRK